MSAKNNRNAQRQPRQRLACIADDFTGAGDWASFYAAAGGKVFLSNGIPETSWPEAQGVPVIALKSRSLPADQAVEEFAKACDYLQAQGFSQIYFKYCSTFDSTPEGNIGPVTDYLLERTEAVYTILAPALPENGRTVSAGILYVNGIPLDETHMRHHPLNPMWSSDLRVLMGAQSKYPVFVLPRETYRHEDKLADFLLALKRKHKHFTLVPDYENDDDASILSECFGNLKLLTGGSGLAKFLGAYQTADDAAAECCQNETAKVPDTLLLAGSTSEATKQQTKFYLDYGAAVKVIDTTRIAEEFKACLPDDIPTLEAKGKLPYFCELKDAVRQIRGPLLLCSDALLSGKKSDVPGASETLELLFGELAALAYNQGVRHFLIAGGETSGAVAKRLNWQIYEIACSLAPGVPLLHPIDDREAAVCYKSGNFGQKDFFIRAAKRMSG